MTQEDARDSEIAVLIAEIKRRYARGLALNISAVRRQAPELLDRAYAIFPFVGWKGLLELAGYGYDGIKIHLEDKVLCPLCGFEGAFLVSHVLRKHAMETEEFTAAYPDSPLLSETILAARMKAVPTAITLPNGERLRLPHWEPLWTLEYCLDRVWHLHQLGLSIHPRNLMRIESALRAKIFEYHPTYGPFLARLGLQSDVIEAQPKKITYSKESLLRIVRERIERGASLRTTLIRQEYSGFSWAVRKHFGTMERLFAACGYPVYEWGRDRVSALDRERMLRAARELSQRSVLSEAAIGEYKRRYRCHCQVFFAGDWSAAAGQAGLPRDFFSIAAAHDWIRNRRDEATPTPRGSLYPTRNSVIDELNRRAREGLSNRSSILQIGRENGGDRTLYQACVRLFGSLDEARKAVGLEPYKRETIRYKEEMVAAKKRSGPTP